MKKTEIIGWAIRRIVMVICDVFICFASYYGALLIRFFSRGSFYSGASGFLNVFRTFFPYYAVIAVVIYLLFGLYSSGWRYPGMNDLNRIFLANALCCIAHIAGTLIFFMRMPTSYYFVGAVAQFLLTVALRFSYRVFCMELGLLRRRRKTDVNIMVVGAGTMGNYLCRQIDKDAKSVSKVACIFDFHRGNSNAINGIPVVRNVEQFAKHVEKYKVNCVILTDANAPADVTKKIKDYCKAQSIDLQDFSGFMLESGYGVTLAKLADCIEGAVTVRLDGEKKEFSSAAEAAAAYEGQYTVSNVSAANGKIALTLQKRHSVLNDTSATWVQQTEKETGEPISFF